MDENVINSLFGCFDRLLRFACKNLVRFAHSFLRASLRIQVNYFSVIDQNNQINTI